MSTSYYRRILSLVLSRPESAVTIYRLLHRIKWIRRNFSKMRDDNVPLPMIITVRLTNRCNLFCRHCGQRGEGGIYKETKASKLLSEELTTQQWMDFLDEVACFKPYIFISGGEPLLRKDLAQIIKFASSRKLLVGLNSNCTMLSQVMAKDLVDSGLTYFYASLDGPEDVHDLMRSGDGIFGRVSKGIKALLAYRDRLKRSLPIVQMDTVITPNNQRNLFETAQIAQELGVDVFGLILSIFTTKELNEATCLWYENNFGIKPKCWNGFIRDMSSIDVVLLQAELARIWNKRWSFKFRPFPPLSTKGFDFTKYFYHPDQPIGNYRCFSPWSSSQIMPNGDVVTCGNHPDYIAGNIVNKNFINIWNSDKYKKFRQVLRGGYAPSCPRCLSFYMFGSG